MKNEEGGGTLKHFIILDKKKKVKFFFWGGGNLRENIVNYYFIRKIPIHSNSCIELRQVENCANFLNFCPSLLQNSSAKFKFIQ